MKLRIFIIDDEECIRYSLKMYLEEKGHEVLTASEPLLCAVYKGHDCDQGHPCGDIALVDFNMPRMSGLDFLHLKSKRGCKTPPANKIIMSGDVSKIDMQKAEELGCVVVQKPVSFEQIDEFLNEAMERIDPNRQLSVLK